MGLTVPITVHQVLSRRSCGRQYGRVVTRYLVRHAKAGQRKDWFDDDRLRPLSNAGWRQATALADWLMARTSGPLLSSTYLRCRQTLEPLGDALGLPVVDEVRLSEGEPFGPALDLLSEAPDGAVFCTHGDLLPELIQALVRRGALLATMPDWRKGVVWELIETDDPLEVRATPFGLLRAWPPPQV